MPPWPRRSQRDREIAALVAERKEFVDPAGWRRSKAGNLWRNYEGATLTVFRRDDGWYAWCIVDAEGKRWAPHGYETREDAMDAIWDELYSELF